MQHSALLVEQADRFSAHGFASRCGDLFDANQVRLAFAALVHPFGSLFLQSLCEACHNSAKRQIELHGFRCDVGLDGLPTDPNHPFRHALK